MSDGKHAGSMVALTGDGFVLRGLAERPFRHVVSGRAGEVPFEDVALGNVERRTTGGGVTLSGQFVRSRILLTQNLTTQADGSVLEAIVLSNPTAAPITVDRLELGFVADLAAATGWRLCAVPFRVQLDGSVHDYTAEALQRGDFRNAVYSDGSRPEPPLTEAGTLRSEAWAWHDGCRGLLVAKYSPDQIELSIARPFVDAQGAGLMFGGAGFSLYGEPSAAQCLAPGASVSFGVTLYAPYAGDVSVAYTLYRAFLDARGHAVPVDYDPPVNWNELYDIGWYHSDPEPLRRNYTRAALEREAAKARDCGCELLYLDPGWEVAEGTTTWDDARLGDVAGFSRMLGAEYGLKLGFRTILRTYVEHWPAAWLVQHAPGAEQGPCKAWYGGPLWEPCLCNPVFRDEKIRRIVDIVRAGDVRFLMVDEMDWRGPCHSSDHGHAVPSTPHEHTRAVMDLCAAVRRACPDLVIECHDPVWPWFSCRYLPTYYGQGFGAAGAFQENWGFEYMWNCVNDLKTGKALALYYYNLGCSIPLYLHITMASDNDHAVFFWWAASTVRHLGIGGKHGHPSVNLHGEPPAFDPGQRFALYREQMQVYRRLKPYFTRGTFHGLGEHAHLHTLPGVQGGVLVLFNISDAERDVRVDVPVQRLGGVAELPVTGASARWQDDAVRITCRLPPMSPRVVCIGTATKCLGT